MKGRKPKPTLLHRLHGNPGGRPLPKFEPKPRGRLVDPPEWLSEDQKASWEYAIERAPLGLLRMIDRGALTVWVVAEDLHRQAVEAQAGLGLIIKAPKTEHPVQSPYLAIINRQGVIMLKAASELGFTPASRPRVQVSRGDPPDSTDAQGEQDLEAFLATDPDAITQ